MELLGNKKRRNNKNNLAYHHSNKAPEKPFRSPTLMKKDQKAEEKWAQPY
mgnify:CR=1 FL=1